ncbi:MAG: acyltransferase family protein, partial [Thermodesulfobacteriota bacterium]
MAGGRDRHIDAMKAVAIILVVMGHAIQVNDPNYDNNLLFRVVFSFQMPMFMFLSGLILSTQFRYTLAVYLKKNAMRLLVPFFAWAIVSYGVNYSYSDRTLAGHLMGVVKAPGTGLWFLWVLFLNSAFLFGVLKLVRRNNWLRWENYFVIAAILISRTASADILGLSEVKQYFPYYAAGFFVYKYMDALKARRKAVYAVALVAFPLLVLGWKRNTFPTFYPFLLQLFNDAGTARLIVSIYKYMVSFTGIAFSSFCLEQIRHTRFYLFLCWLGTLTLDIYVCHGYFRIELGNGVWQY